MSAADFAKIQAAAAALEFIEDGMIVGLGTGSTANHFISMLGERAREGLSIGCVPTSEASKRLAMQEGLTFIDIDQADRIDVTVDGADEIDTHLNLIKGGGGALLREKIIAHATDHMVVIADKSKSVQTLGKFPLPIEVIGFGFTITAKKVFDVLRATGCAAADVKMRETGTEGHAFVTDNGNFILDCACGIIPDPVATCAALNTIPGVVENGIFLPFPRTVRTVLLGHDDGVDVIEA
jgi:ribose 5-phosphate isomerase A